MKSELFNSCTENLENWREGNPEKVFLDGIERYHPICFRGKQHSLPVHRVPLEFLKFNSGNGRLTTEIKSLEAEKNIIIDPNNGAFGSVIDGSVRYEISGHAKIIMDLLLEKRKNNLKKDFIDGFGQKDPICVTSDGVIINGNTRVAMQIKEFMKTRKRKYLYIDTIFLPSDLTQRELYDLECRLSIVSDGKEPYSDLNIMYKIKEGIDQGCEVSELAELLDLTEQDIDLNMQKIGLIEKYQQRFGKDSSDFAVARGMLGQIEYTVKGMNKANKYLTEMDDLISIESFSLNLMHVLQNCPEETEKINIQGLDTNKRDAYIRPLFTTIIPNDRGRETLLAEINSINFEKDVKPEKIISTYQSASTAASINGKSGLIKNVGYVCTKFDGFIDFMDQGGTFPDKELIELVKIMSKFLSYSERKIVNQDGGN